MVPQNHSQFKDAYVSSRTSSDVKIFIFTRIMSLDERYMFIYRMRSSREQGKNKKRDKITIRENVGTVNQRYLL